jgi:hypothetical protein
LYEQHATIIHNLWGIDTKGSILFQSQLNVQGLPYTIVLMGDLGRSTSRAVFHMSEGCGHHPPFGRWGSFAQTLSHHYTSGKEHYSITSTFKETFLYEAFFAKGPWRAKSY